MRTLTRQASARDGCPWGSGHTRCVPQKAAPGRRKLQGGSGAGARPCSSGTAAAAAAASARGGRERPAQAQARREVPPRGLRKRGIHHMRTSGR